MHAPEASPRSDRVFLAFQVSDTGKGISAEQQRQLFTPYYQCDTRITREQEGTGLGLSIVKQVVQLMQGTISVGWRDPGTQTVFFGIMQFKHPHPRSPKTPLLACGVQQYGW